MPDGRGGRSRPAGRRCRHRCCRRRNGRRSGTGPRPPTTRHRPSAPAKYRGRPNTRPLPCVRMGSPERIRPVTREEWERVRDLRLHALADAPDAFGSTLERERSLGRPGWIAWIEGWEGATNVLFVAERGDRWIGMAVGSRTGEEADAH